MWPRCSLHSHNTTLLQTTTHTDTHTHTHTHTQTLTGRHTYMPILYTCLCTYKYACKLAQ